MAEIRLISILPTQVTQGVQQPPSTTTQSPGIMVNLPGGSILSGYIVNRDLNGNPILRTEKGDVAFESDFFLKIGSEVVIRVENRAGNTLAHILSVNGQPPAVAESTSGYADTPDVVTSSQTQQSAAGTKQTAVPQDIARVPQTVTVSGTLISPAAPDSEQPALPAGTQISLKVISLATPANTAAAPTVAQPTNPALYAVYARTAETSPPTNTVVTAPPTGTTPPPATTTTATPPPLTQVAPQPGQSITATVMATEPTGETLVQTPLGIVRLQPGMALPQGSQVTFEIASITPGNLAPASGAAAPAPASMTQLAQQWQTLQQLFTLLSGREPGVGQPLSGFELLAAGNAPWLPQTANPGGIPPQALSSGIMLFISALRGGDFRGWLGKTNTQWLEDMGHGNLIRKAEGEFFAIARQFSETSAQQWQTLFFPVAVAGDWQQVRMFVKRDRKEGSSNQKKPKSEDTRFVIEAELSQLGEIQLDGFVRKQPQAVEFDLFIRTLHPLANEVQQDIIKIYNHTGELTGYKGTLLFQSVKEFPVNPMEEVMAQALGNVTA